MSVRPLLRLAAASLFLAFGPGAAAEPPAAAPTAAPARVRVPAMRTSIYVGTVTLTPAVFTRTGDTWAATYAVKVRPWFFWGETGRIALTVAAADWARLAQGEVVEFAGEATNERGRPRHVTGRAEPGGPAAGRLTVRITADGVTLVFHGTYALE